MNYAEAIQAIGEGHAVVRLSWQQAGVCIVSFRLGAMTWLDGHKVVPWNPSNECKIATDWILADDVREQQDQSRALAVWRLKAESDGGGKP